MSQQTRKGVVSHSPSCRNNVGNRNRESCANNFFDELTKILDECRANKDHAVQLFINSRFSDYKGDCLARLLLGEFLFKNQDCAQIPQKYLLLYPDNRSIAFLLTVGQFEKDKTTVLNIMGESKKSCA